MGDKLGAEITPCWPFLSPSPAPPPTLVTGVITKQARIPAGSPTHSVSRLCSPSKLWVPTCWMRLLWRCLRGKERHVRMCGTTSGPARADECAQSRSSQVDRQNNLSGLTPSLQGQASLPRPTPEATIAEAGPTTGQRPFYLPSEGIGKRKGQATATASSD